jgi:hypothetical protein
MGRAIGDRDRQRVTAQTLALAFGILLAIVFGFRPCEVTVGWRQPGDVVLLCRGVDPVRLWPGPVRAHYWEDPDRVSPETGGQIAMR